MLQLWQLNYACLRSNCTRGATRKQKQVKSNFDDLISVAPVGWILTW